MDAILRPENEAPLRTVDACHQGSEDASITKTHIANSRETIIANAVADADVQPSPEDSGMYSPYGPDISTRYYLLQKDGPKVDLFLQYLQYIYELRLRDADVSVAELRSFGLEMQISLWQMMEVGRKNLGHQSQALSSSRAGRRQTPLETS
ncbi:hypothetical protein BJ508DRAFT_380133 [Ascobolus immersus RN42]|uniref:Uncharacterized protein n=1 Tax=Ascobolus immersus RN42 TaxID=1160509 RepID=A0A3N4I0C5_ASCIM|nr:hypothetical protein BJ508DRAFT_380133 [Ascobolus immersus RN42]